MRYPPNTPFSHIQIIPKSVPPDSVDDGPTSPDIVFQNPSYSQQAEKKMAAPHNLHQSNSTVSLANNTSGTTFAARARAAELNAVRARRAAKESEMEDKVPPAAPVALGALKFTMPRNHGKSWKSLNVTAHQDESSHDEDSSSERAKSPEHVDSQLDLAKGYPRSDAGDKALTYKDLAYLQGSYQSTFNPSFPHQQPLVSPPSKKGEETAPNYNVTGHHTSDGWNPAMPPARLGGNERHLQPSPAFRQTSNVLLPTVPNSQSGQMKDTGIQGSSTPNLHKQAEHMFEGDNAQHQQRLNSSEEMRLMKLGVLPALNSMEARTYSYDKSHQDPFVESSYLQPTTHIPYAGEQSFSSSSGSTVRAPLVSAVKGTANQEFRFPQAYQSRQNTPPQQLAPKSEQGQTNVPTGPKANIYQRDPMPYSGFSATSKKDLLLRNLHDVVESSKTQGNLPTSTRTVLYDPLAHDPGQTAQPSTSKVPFQKALDALNLNPLPGTGFTTTEQVNKESLKVSDPLPWTDRPVSIHDSASPTSPQTSFATPKANLRRNQMPPPGFGFNSADIWSFAPQDHPACSWLDEVESWWTTGARRCRQLEDSSIAGIGNKAEGRNAKPADITDTDGCTRGGDNALKITTDGEVAAKLMIPALQTLVSYVDGTPPDYFHRFARVPEWCIDKSHGGNRSFFGDWGVPPSRVGRDPRYRPTFHEGRYTVFEELDRRGSRDGLARRFG